MNDRIRELERRTRAAFDESVASVDAGTRARLARARARAIAELRQSRARGPALWIPVGAAAAALVAAMLWQREEGRVPPPHAAPGPFEDLDMMASGEDFDMLHEDEGFYAWAEQQMSDGVG